MLKFKFVVIVFANYSTTLIIQMWNKFKILFFKYTLNRDITCYSTFIFMNCGIQSSFTDRSTSSSHPISIQIGGEQPSAKDFRNMLNDSMRTPSMLVKLPFLITLRSTILQTLCNDFLLKRWNLKQTLKNQKKASDTKRDKQYSYIWNFLFL